MTTAKEFLSTVIAPTLAQIGLDSKAAEELLLGTALQESDLIHRRQIGGGPGLGYYQMEPATHDDIWNNYLKYHKALAQKIEALVAPSKDRLTALQMNDRYATAMARVLYLRAPAPLPPAGDIEAMANYWKRYYNTPLGAGKPEQFVAKWKKYVGS